MSKQNSVRPLRLYMVKGSFFRADDGRAPAMKARVWRRLPEELIWEVLRYVPAATQFRLQLVSRKWRQVLTSAHFRNTMATTLVAAAAASRQPKEEEERVIACVSRAFDHAAGPGGGGDDPDSDRVRAVDIDLSSFVPTSFWASSSSLYTVEAAADGLVLISNRSHEDEAWEAGKTRYCVLNPLTRTCKVLPEVPFEPEGWLPLTPTAVTMFGKRAWWAGGEKPSVATYDLIGGGSGVWDVTAASAREPTGSSVDPVVTQCRICCGQSYVHESYRLMQVLLPRPDGGRLAAAGPALKNSLTVLWGVAAWLGRSGAHLKEHLGGGGFLKLHAEWQKMRGYNQWPEMRGLDVVMGVWRLARHVHPGWEVVALLDSAKVERLTRVNDIMRKGKLVTCRVWGALGARNLLYCTLLVDMTPFVVGLNMDTGKWQRLDHDDEHTLLHVPITSQPFELRPDLFLEKKKKKNTCSF